jgi:hypothetical protein
MQKRPNSASSTSSVAVRPSRASNASRACRNRSARISGSCSLPRHATLRLPGHQLPLPPIQCKVAGPGHLPARMIHQRLLQQSHALARHSRQAMAGIGLGLVAGPVNLGIDLPSAVQPLPSPRQAIAQGPHGQSRPGRGRCRWSRSRRPLRPEGPPCRPARTAPRQWRQGRTRTSRVVPATGAVIAASFSSKALKSVDLPALGGPARATRKPSRKGSAEGRSKRP